MHQTSVEYDARSESLRSFDSIAFLAKLAGIQSNPRVRKALRAISSNPLDSKTVQEIATNTIRCIQSTPEFLAQQRDQNPFRPYPDHRVTGPIQIGRVYHPRVGQPPIFGLYPYELNQNMLVAGRAGSGKTNLLMVVAEGLLKYKIPFWLIDFKKDYRHMIRRHPHLLVFNWRNFKYNPLAPPPGTDPLHWIQTLTDIFFQAFFPTPAVASKSAFLEILERLVTEANQQRGQIPTFFDLGEAFLQYSEGKGAWPHANRDRLRSCSNRIRPLLRFLGPMLDCELGYPLDQLLNQNVVFELDGLTEEIQTFLLNLLLYWVFYYRLHRAQRGQLLHCIFFDEGKRVFAKEIAKGTSMISRLVSTAREMGQGLVVADQMPSTLGHAILANVHTMVALNLSAAKDLQSISYAMGLNREQHRYLNRSPVGMGVVKMADRHPEPFLIQIPLHPIKKDVTDEELQRHMAPNFASLTYRPRHPAPEPPLSSAGQTSKDPGTDQNPNASNSPFGRGSLAGLNLSEFEITVLTDMKNRPYVSTVERTRSLHLTNYMANKVTRGLLKKQLIEEVEIKIGRRGRAAKYYKLTKQSEQAIGPQNLGPGKGGFEHVFHQQRLQRRFARLGYEAKIEDYRNGKSADIGLVKNGRTLAIEIAMSPQGEIVNIVKDLRAGWDEVWVVCRDSKVLQQVEREWSQEPRGEQDGKVEFRLVSDPIFDSKTGEVSI